jgi:hypothetical protein
VRKRRAACGIWELDCGRREGGLGDFY